MARESFDVAVLVTVFNKRDFVKDALLSILPHARHARLEVLVVDDLSTDGSREIVAQICKDQENFRLIKNDSNLGIGSSLRRAYALTTARYVTVLDADDLWLGAEKIQSQVEFLDRNLGCFAVGHNSFVLYPDSRSLGLISMDSKQRTFTYAEALSGEVYLHTSSLMFRRIPSGLPKQFDMSALDGDTPFFLWHLLQHKSSLAYTPDVSSVYRLTEGGHWTGQSAAQQQRTNIALMRAVLRYFVGLGELRERRVLARRIRGEKKRQHLNIVESQPLLEIGHLTGDDSGMEVSGDRGGALSSDLVDLIEIALRLLRQQLRR
jgi:glycosyltransferase involved in cell wall biosynthesis